MKTKIDQLMAAPTSAQSPFIYGGQTRKQIHEQGLNIHSAAVHHNRPGAPVCLCSEDRGQVAAALLATLSGGPPLILPYAFSNQALAETRHALAYDLALTNPAQPIPSEVQRLDINQVAKTDLNPAPHNPLEPDDVWVYLFTGGSTGKPKTWTKTVSNLLAEAHHLVETFHITAEDTILATVPPHHIYGLLYSVLIPLVSGAQVVAATPSFPNEILHALEETQATILVSIPPHYRALTSHPLSRHHLRMAFSSAGALAPEDDQAFHQATGVTLSEVYGSTETGGIAVRQRAQGQSALTPFDCVDWKIEDERLWVKSSFLSPELATDQAGYFQTADRAAADQNQGFNLMGRSDGIIKVAGKRVDLAAVQQTLKQISGVRDAYVFSRAVDKSRENEVLAMVEGDLGVEKIRAALQPKLEPYAQPRQISVVAKIPISKVGKYNRAEIENHFS